MWFIERTALTRAFELMEQYADHPMDLANASLVAAAESLGTRQVFTIDRKDFEIYRVRRGLASALTKSSPCPVRAGWEKSTAPV